MRNLNPKGQISKASILIKKKKKTAYKVRNWKAYNESLVNRYDITVWIKKGYLKIWEEKIPIRKRKQGAQRKYSNTAIHCLVTIKYLFRLPYRGLEGLSKSLFSLILISPVPIPDYSTIQRRQQFLKGISLLCHNHKEKKKAIDIVLDSTGLKVYGEGEWVVRIHGKSKQRTWRKIHIGLNPKTQMIEAVETTNNSFDDAQLIKPLMNQLKQRKISSFFGDGGYDKRGVYDVLQARQVHNILIPPRINACPWGTTHPRNKNIQLVQKAGGKDMWKKQTGYHTRSLVETSIYRFKRIFGDTLSHRTLENQQAEVRMKCHMLNLMTNLGMPESYPTTIQTRR